VQMRRSIEHIGTPRKTATACRKPGSWNTYKSPEPATDPHGRKKGYRIVLKPSNAIRAYQCNSKLNKRCNSNGKRGALLATARNLLGRTPSVMKSRTRRGKNTHRTYRLEKAPISDGRKHPQGTWKEHLLIIYQAAVLVVGVVLILLVSCNRVVTVIYGGLTSWI
jgi:hypothetical protein